MNRIKAYRAGIAAVILIVSQWACQAPLSPPATATPAATRTAHPTATVSATEVAYLAAIARMSDDEIMAGIQTSLDKYAEAHKNNDPELLETVVDQQNKPLRRVVRNRFNDFQASYQAGDAEVHFEVIEIIRREYGFVLAHFARDDGYEGEWSFRYVDGRWVISEPSVEQIGRPVWTETDHFSFTTYPWADDVNPFIMELMDTARENVEAVLGKVPAQKVKVVIMPIYGLYPLNPTNFAAGYWQGVEPRDDEIQIYIPYSFPFQYYDSELGWDGELRQTLTHEYTHLTHTRSFDNAGVSAEGLYEGLAEYVAGVQENSLQACDAMANGTMIPILDETTDTNPQDLMHMYQLEENFGLSYRFAASLVEFTIENYGGLEGYWKLAKTLDKTGDFKEAVQEAFGISYDEYNQQWQTWLKGKC